MRYPAEQIEALEREAAEWLEAHPGRARSIFPKIEALLQCVGYQAALAFVGSRRANGPAHDAIDALFCELFPEHLELATDYINDRNGYRLRDMFSNEHLQRFERAMLCLLAIAVALRKEHDRDDPCPISWHAIVETARALSVLGPPITAASH